MQTYRQHHEETALKIAYALEPYGYQLGETAKERGQLMTRIEAPYGSANRSLSIILNGSTAQVYLSGRHVDGVRHPGDEDGQKVVQRLRKYGLVTTASVPA